MFRFVFDKMTHFEVAVCPVLDWSTHIFKLTHLHCGAHTLLVCTMFERRLLQEKKRLSSSFPPSPYPDQDECERLIEAHQHWVLNGDELKPDDIDDDSETTYPLQHNAYKRRDVTPSDTAAGDDTADDDDAAATGAAAQADFRPVTPPCDTSLLCSVCEQNPVGGDFQRCLDPGPWYGSGRGRGHSSGGNRRYPGPGIFGRRDR